MKRASDKIVARLAIANLVVELNELQALAQRQGPSARQAMMTNIGFIRSNLVGLGQIVDVEVPD